MRIHPEVERALRAHRPVVAVETTVFAHGLPPDVARRTWEELREGVRSEGATPAPIAVVRGEVRVGLDEDGWTAVWSGRMEKAGLADLPRLVAVGGSGATTVASTAVLAHRAGIRVFATGGLGGVHREAERTRDVSADLFALARTPVVGVCSGPKSILDVGATLEVLETLGIVVLGFRTDRAPAFYVADSGLPVHRVETEEEVARIRSCGDRLGLEAAVVVFQSPPDPLDPAVHDRVVRTALDEAEEAGVRGKALTPFLLRRLHEATGGATVAVNRKLLVANARLAARIAQHLAGTRPASEVAKCDAC